MRPTMNIRVLKTGPWKLISPPNQGTHTLKCPPQGLAGCVCLGRRSEVKAVASVLPNSPPLFFRTLFFRARERPNLGERERESTVLHKKTPSPAADISPL